MAAKQIGKKQKCKPFKINDGIYDFEYKLENALSLLQRAKISDHDREKILEFAELLKALRVSKGESPSTFFT
ncbi:MAG: hypothetical protein PXY39_00120 [archaeon]|nr:hypothetical protein [archaeon]